MMNNIRTTHVGEAIHADYLLQAARDRRGWPGDARTPGEVTRPLTGPRRVLRTLVVLMPRRQQAHQ
ncbi:MAG: hypothetical protein NVSMB65_20500 [Chloroflexota bacterium]